MLRVSTRCAPAAQQASSRFEKVRARLGAVQRHCSPRPKRALACAALFLCDMKPRAGTSAPLFSGGPPCARLKEGGPPSHPPHASVHRRHCCKQIFFEQHWDAIH